MHEGIVGGPRLAYFMQQIAPIRARMAVRFRAVQSEGGLPQFSEDTFLLALLMLGAVPFALGAFSNELCQVDLRRRSRWRGTPTACWQPCSRRRRQQGKGNRGRKKNDRVTDWILSAAADRAAGA